MGIAYFAQAYFNNIDEGTFPNGVQCAKSIHSWHIFKLIKELD
jgi:hypothetical protein